jgi:hypothetical protein
LSRDSNSTLIQDGFRERLAGALQIPLENLTPESLRKFFEDKVPLGTHKGLTYFVMLICRLWELWELNDMATLGTLLCLSAVYLEQVAIDGGRQQVAWLLTGLNQPAFNLTSLHTQRNQEEPFALLADPVWINAQIAYLKDLDYFTTRQSSIAKGGSPAGGPPGSPSATPVKAKVRTRPKGKPKAKGKGSPEDGHA